jgi:hypothetical protein
MKFSGHGLNVESTLIQLYADHVDGLNSHLSFLSTVCQIHLKHVSGLASAAESGLVESERFAVQHREWYRESNKLKSRVLAAMPYDVYEYKSDISFLSFRRRKSDNDEALDMLLRLRPHRSKFATSEETTFVIAHALDGSHFFVENTPLEMVQQAPALAILKTRQPQDLPFYPLKVVRTGTNGDASDWELTYLDKSKQVIEGRFALFERFRGVLRQRRLSITDMPLNIRDFLDAPFLTRDPGDWSLDATPAGAYVTRPRVPPADQMDQYITDLKSLGAVRANGG